MAAHLYYDHNQPIMSDARYDRLSKYVSDYFDHLHPTRIWQLRNRKIIRTTGHHIKLTAISIVASHKWYYHKFKRWPLHHEHCLLMPRKFSPTNGTYYAIRG